MTSSALTTLLAAVAAAQRPVILIDGGAGAGKSTLAKEIAESWPSGTLQVVCTDDFCPGWEGLETATKAVPAVITEGQYVGWDWEHNRVSGLQLLVPEQPLLIEGCGAISAASKALATLSIWVDAPDDLRKKRALERDADMFAPHWDSWADQEAAHWRSDQPWELADVTVSTE